MTMRRAFAPASGFVLLPVVLTLALLALVIALLLERGGTGGSTAARQQQSDALAYAASAGFNHGRALLERNGCLNASAVSDTALGDYSYSATMTATGATVPAPVYQLTAAADAWLNEDDDEDNRGSDNVLKNKNDDDKDLRSILRFDFSSVPADFAVSSATLWLYVKSKDDSGDPVEIYRVTDSWSEGWVTWENTAGDSDDDIVHGSFVPDEDGYVSADLTALVRQWLAGKIDNYGIVLKSTSNERESQYASREESSAIRPRLEIVGRATAIYTVSAVGSDSSGLQRKLSRTIPGPAASALFLDYFDAGYGGNDGTQAFSGGWQEIGESNGPGSGAVRVVTQAGDCAYGSCIEIDAGLLSTAGVWRQLNLAGAANAILRLHTRRQGGHWALQVSGNGGSSWQTLKSTGSGVNDDDQVRDVFDISAYAAADTRIRITSSSLLGLNNYVYVDDVEIDATCVP